MTNTGHDAGAPAATDQAELTPAPELDPSTPLAPRWRHWVAHSIDLTVVLIVFALFLAPVIVVYSRGGRTSGLLKGSAWVYVVVFVGLAASMARGRKHERRGLAMALIAFPVMLLGVAFFVFELMSYL